MSTTVTIKLGKDAHKFHAVESIGFGIRGGVQYYDRESKEKKWTNYQAVIFAKNPAQIQFYQSALVAGAVVEVTCKQLAVKQFNGNNGLQISLDMIDASLGLIHNNQPQQQAGYPQQSAPQQPQQYNNAPPVNQPMGVSQQPQGQPQSTQFDDDIPF